MGTAWCNMHLLGELGHAPAMKVFSVLYTLRSLLRPFLTTNTIVSVLSVCSLHVHMKTITHANKWSLILAFHMLIYPGTSEFYMGRQLGMPGCSYATERIGMDAQ